MKKHFLLLIFIFSLTSLCYSQNENSDIDSLQNCQFTPLKVAVSAIDNETNLRKKPNGKIILKLNHLEDYYSVQLIELKNGWFKTKTVISIEGADIKIPGGTAWIHSSEIVVGTRKNVKLLDAPKTGNMIGTIEQETSVRILDVCFNWVKIEYNELSGWVNSEWLCGNPVTTCP